MTKTRGKKNRVRNPIGKLGHPHRRVVEKQRRSLAGFRGSIVGAPPKNVRFPNRKFTIQQLLDKNLDISSVTIRNRIMDCLPISQQGNACQIPKLVRLPNKEREDISGRRPAVYILKSFHQKEMGLWKPAKVHKRKVKKLTIAVTELNPAQTEKQIPVTPVTPEGVPVIHSPTVTDDAPASVIG